eukprot:TRINITY_DN10580_c0_g1_i1.p1 TRINITY_DN10580_c0_g1~~TRINITY_DN10580_c0_g1_i1.p1  ORF type:complete len:544 (+),score=109.59 TRINITY_DN10580_c0_g1_i1:3-1634(+)
MVAKQRVLVAGAVLGQFDKLFARVAKIIAASGEFHALFITGKLFVSGDELAAYISGEKEVVIPTYFLSTASDREYPVLKDAEAGKALCKNLTYLGEQGLTEIDGITVAFASGTYDPLQSTPPHIDYDPINVEAMLKTVGHNQFLGVDMLLTNEWPFGLLNGISEIPRGVSMLQQDKVGASVVAQVASAVVPRYHFASTAKGYGYYERPLYKNGAQFPKEKQFHATRFIGIAPCFNTKGKANKFLYAFSLEPLNRGVDASTLYAAPGATSFPFTKLVVPKEAKSLKRKEPEGGVDGRFDGGAIDYNKAKPGYAMPGGGKRRRQHKLTSGARADECWFCMSSSVCEMHLIVSVAKHFYLASAKGAMTETHMLLSPVLHLSNSTELNGEQRVEMKAWKTALTKFHSSNDMVPVFFEISPPAGRAKRHMLLQCVPVYKKDSEKCKKLFHFEANKEKLDLLEIGEGRVISDIIGMNCPYIYVHFPDGTEAVASLEDLRVPFSFGRLVLAKLMGNMRLEDWKKCILREKEEEKVTLGLREKFLPFQLPS